METYHRIVGWEGRLHRAVERFFFLPFDWGSNNCTHFAGACVEAVIGVNPIAHLTGTYTDEAGALALLAEYGGDVEAATARFFPRIDGPKALARRGDLGVIDYEGRKFLAVVLGARCGVVSAPGLCHFSRKHLTAAYAVGGWNNA